MAVLDLALGTRFCTQNNTDVFKKSNGKRNSVVYLLWSGEFRKKATPYLKYHTELYLFFFFLILFER